MDVDLDDRISLHELAHYVTQTQVPIDNQIVIEMYQDATKGRGVVHDGQRMDGLTLEEIQYAVRGRHSWNTETKQWGVTYRPYRNYWILLLLTVNDRLFALQVPKVVPGKIVAQYEEQEAIRNQKTSLSEMLKTKKEGIDRRYLHVKDKVEPMFTRNQDKAEAGVTLDPEGQLAFASEKKKKKEQKSLYETKVNGKVEMVTSDKLNETGGFGPPSPRSLPTFTFDAKEMYE